MYRFCQVLLWTLFRLLLRLRYRVRVTGLEKLRDLEGPTLLMPNHPGYIDPPLVLSHVRLKATIRPLVYSGTYRNPALYPIMRAVGAFEVPNLAEQSRGAREQTLGMIDSVIEGIERGGSFLIYPSGRIQRGNREVIGAARAAWDILQRCPDLNVVLVRTRGVWGSMFSFARTGRLPSLGKCTLRGLAWMAANLIFFAPRREVTMSVEVVDRNQLPVSDRAELNEYLEAWYNRAEGREPVFVPYHRIFGPREFDFPKPPAALDIDVDKIKPATREAVGELIEDHLGRPLTEEERLPQTTLDQIGLDSLARMDAALEIEDRFGFRSDQVATTIGELWALAEGLASGAPGEVEPAPDAWQESSVSDEPAEVLAETLAEAFVRRALANPGDVAVADRLSGVLSYRRMLVGSSLLGKRMAKLEGDAVGIMLPASAAADLVFFALHLAGKLPVILNWTTGPANLAHAVKKLKLQHIVTSSKFVDRLGIEVEGADYAFLEDLRADIGKGEGLGALLASYLMPGGFLRRLPRQQCDDPAVVLFTSGSESAPKAVPLSHRNLIANVRGGVTALKPTRGDAMMGFLPPFHSFGIMGTVVLPILTGIRLVHYADPTDAAGLVRTVVAYRPTFMLTTPTFLGYMLGVAKPGDLESLTTIGTGAEKCPEAIFVRSGELAPAAKVLEGYGITECSPVVSCNRPDNPRDGTVGQPLDGVELCVVHPDSNEPLATGETGMLLVHGPSIFSGYIDHDGPEPFVELDGRRWYNTGDLVQLDEDRFIHFRGRLKRFIKAGGEMVSLPALEEPFAKLYPTTEDGPQVAVEGVETPNGRHIVLFSVGQTTVREANAVLAEAGFRGVMRVDETRQVDAISVLGTGKTDYKVLRKMVLDELESEE